MLGILFKKGRFALSLLVLGQLLVPVVRTHAQRRGADAVLTPLFQTGSESRREWRRSWDARPPRRQGRRVALPSGGHAVRIGAGTPGTYLLQRSLPVDAVAGRKLYVRLRVRNESISTPPAFYNGIKAALHITTPTETLVPQAVVAATPGPWQSVGFGAVVPAAATACTLWVGLESVSGTVYFDDIEVCVLDTVAAPPAPPAAGPVLRGAMVPTFITADSLRVLASWGANHVRWQLTWEGFPHTPADTASLTSYRAWLRGATAHVQSLLPLCDSLGLHVLLDLHTLPGGLRFEADRAAHHRLFETPAWQAAFLAIWRDLAAQFRDAPAVWGYDVANEPIEGAFSDSVLTWQQLAMAAAQAIRTADPRHVVVMEGAPGGEPVSLPGIQPLAGAAPVAYSFHMYTPGTFTQQGIEGRSTGVRYPGVIDGRAWDSGTLRATLQPLRDWQLRHGGVPVYIGEFSAVRWAPDSSAYRYLRDCIRLFEDWGWSWAYHAFREWDGWSVEHGPDPADPAPAPAPTDRQLLLQEAFRKNRH